MTSKEIVASLNDEDRDQFNKKGVSEKNTESAERKGDGVNRRMKRQTFEVDLSKLQGEGDFPCPKCGIVISPDDESEETYTVLDTKGDEDLLEEILIHCKKCGSTIRLKGFEELAEAEFESKVEISEPQASSQPRFRTIHTLSIDGKAVGRVIIEYLQEEDVKAFSKINRDLKVGDAFQARVFIDSSSGVTADQLASKGLGDVVKVLKRRGKGLRERDIFLVAVEGGRERLVGRVENLVRKPSD
jgi:ssDNA-binding Zn-finger/Zn-ribbon topoisomerase 1